MRGNAHVRFGGRAGETERPRGRNRAPVRPYYLPVRPEGPREGVLVAWGFDLDGERVLLDVCLGGARAAACLQIERTLIQRRLRAAWAEPDPVWAKAQLEVLACSLIHRRTGSAPTSE